MFKIGSDTNDDGRVVAAFDLDYTLVKPNGKHKFAKDENDWQWMTFPYGTGKISVLEGLRILSHKNHQLVVFTNQLHEKNGARQKITNIANELKRHDIIVTFYASTENNFYRKPRIGMYNQFKIDFPKSGHMYYCGDAAGRVGDFSASDWAFALNISGLHTLSLTWEDYTDDIDNMRNIIDFVPPEEFFGEQLHRSDSRLCNRQQPLVTSWNGPQDWRPSSKQPDWRWTKCIPDFEIIPEVENTVDVDFILDAIAGTLVDNPKDNGILLVLMMGSPASGKTTCAKAICEEFKDDFEGGVNLVSKDDFPTPAKSFKKFNEYISKGQSVVIDGCHATQASRKKYMDVVLKMKNVRSFVVNARTDKPTSMLLNQRRAWESQIKAIPDVGIHVWYKNYEDPLLDPWVDVIPLYPYGFNTTPSMRVY